jgi:hypothetical protein
VRIDLAALLAADVGHRHQPREELAVATVEVLPRLEDRHPIAGRCRQRAPARGRKLQRGKGFADGGAQLPVVTEIVLQPVRDKGAEVFEHAAADALALEIPASMMYWLNASGNFGCEMCRGPPTPRVSEGPNWLSSKAL